MSIKTFTYFDAGVELRDQASDAGANTEGQLYQNTGKIKAYLQSAVREIITNNQIQTLTNKTIDADLNTITNIENADIKVGAAIDATKIADGSISNTEFQYLNGVSSSVVGISDAQTLTNKSIDADANTITNIDNADIKTGANIARAKLASANLNAFVGNDGSGVMTDVTNMTHSANAVVLSNLKHLETQAATDSTTTGADATLASFTAGVVRLTNGSLTSLSNIPAGGDGQQLIVINRTGVSFTLKDQSSAVGTAANRIFTGTGASITVATDSALIFEYDLTSARWQVIGGTGGDATSAVDTVFAIKDATDPSKQIKFDAGGTTATSTTLAAAQTTNRTVNLPDASDTLVARATTDTLTNKTIVAANNTITTAASGNLTSTSLNAALAELQGDIDFNREQTRVFLLDNTEGVSAWSTGNNASFLGGGTLSGTFANETSSPLNGTQSYKYTQAAGSLNDYFVSAAQSVPLKFRGQQVYLNFPYQYNGNSTDILVVLYDATNSAIINTSGLDYVTGTNGSTSNLIVGGIIPLTCTSIRVGFQVKTLNSGKIFSFDDLELNTVAYPASSIANISEWQAYTPTFQGLGTVTNIEFQYRQVGSNYEIRGKATSGTTTATELRIGLPTNSITANTLTLPSIAVVGCSFFGFSSATGYINNAQILAEPNVTYLTVQAPMTSSITKVNGSAVIGTGSIFSIFASVPIAGLIASSSSVVVPNQQISSDTLPFVFKSTAIVDSDPVGTFNTFTYTANTNTAVISASAPTQTTSDMNISGVRVFSRSYNVTGSPATPPRVDVKIGKGLRSNQVVGYVSANKVEAFVTDYSQLSDGTTEVGTTSTYDEKTGILTITAGVAWRGSNSIRYAGQRLNGDGISSGYFVFNASTAPSISALPILAPRIAYLSDVKANGTAGGSASAATTATRTLNTLVDSTGIVTSLSSNQFVLPAGTYDIYATAPTYGVSRHKIRLRNITAGTTAIVGQNAFNNGADNGSTAATLQSEVTITAATTFEIQHYTESAQATNGFGFAVSNGESEVYTQVKITKIR